MLKYYVGWADGVHGPKCDVFTADSPDEYATEARINIIVEPTKRIIQVDIKA